MEEKKTPKVREKEKLSSISFSTKPFLSTRWLTTRLLGNFHWSSSPLRCSHVPVVLGMHHPSRRVDRNRVEIEDNRRSGGGWFLLLRYFSTTVILRR
ncbi:hypothetical protein BHE74_00033373 [Ensete ventricosum]|nr:hypothetical protein GW17_00001391 [Ensete ventricosum]RWW59677.1 hypothetical protein BHE74_00033373 [Ensete ventricosum]RZR96840.1 hypothetical protein BHM03_00025919 [Ensete ventricosum]